MKTLRHSLWMGLAASCVAFAAHAQDFKIGFVNTDRIFREASSAKAAQAKLEQEFSRREKELVETGNTLKAASEKFEREAPTLAESQRAARQKQAMLLRSSAARTSCWSGALNGCWARRSSAVR